MRPERTALLILSRLAAALILHPVKDKLTRAREINIPHPFSMRTIRFGMEESNVISSLQ